MNNRRKNRAEMTITEQFEAIKEQMCDNYCRFPALSKETIEDENEAFEWLMNEHCSNCPLNRL